MEQTKLDRINELTRLSKERELTLEEIGERQSLRAEYIAEWRRATIETLDSVYIDDGKGNITKLKKKK